MKGHHWVTRSCQILAGLVASFVVSSPAAAQIYKCVSHGRAAYQDTPCPGDPPPKILHAIPPLASPASPMQPSRVMPVPPTLDQSAFKAPATMSLSDIYNQLRMLGARARELQHGRDQEMQQLRIESQASIKHLKGRQGLMTEWAAETRKGVRRIQSRNADPANPTHQFTKELRAILDKPLPSGNMEQRSRAIKEREQAIARLHDTWDPKLREDQRAMSAENRAMEQQNTAYQRKIDTYDRQREIRALRARYAAEASRVQDRWLPRIRVVEARQKALQDELHRRCPHGAMLSPHSQRCYP